MSHKVTVFLTLPSRKEFRTRLRRLHSLPAQGRYPAQTEPPLNAIASFRATGVVAKAIRDNACLSQSLPSKVGRLSLGEVLGSLYRLSAITAFVSVPIGRASKAAHLFRMF